MYLQKIEITNFSCLRDVKIEFTPLHALIGPNDSGKSTILRAVRTLTHSLAMAMQPPEVGMQGLGFDQEANSKLVGQFDHLRFAVQVSHGQKFRISGRYSELNPVEIEASGEQGFRGFLTTSNNSPPFIQALEQNPNLAPRVRMPAGLLRLDPDDLRQESDLIPEKEAVSFSEYRGRGMTGLRLPGIYDSIMNRGDDSFSKIAQRTRDLFPTVRNVRLRTVSNSQKSLEVELTDGTRVPAAQMSEGLLYFLAYAALPYIAPASILLVEEPENGLHPSRIRDVMNILKEISKTTQVIIATHSPLVVNELNGDEVTVVTRDAVKGTMAHRLNATADYAVRSKVYLPGELWLNYANGVDEADLFSSGKPET
jgi:predicted ATPase